MMFDNFVSAHYLHNCQVLNRKITHKITSKPSPNVPKPPQTGPKLKKKWPEIIQRSRHQPQTFQKMALKCSRAHFEASKKATSRPEIVFARKPWTKSEFLTPRGIFLALQNPFKILKDRPKVKPNGPNVSPKPPKHSFPTRFNVKTSGLGVHPAIFQRDPNQNL